MRGRMVSAAGSSLTATTQSISIYTQPIPLGANNPGTNVNQAYENSENLKRKGIPAAGDITRF